jgi:uncharacterized protein YdaU (DUF1376 family)
MSRQPVDPWFKFFPRDWLDGTRELTLEQRGAYIDAIAMQMVRGGPLPDDYTWLSHQMHISVRKARSIVEELVVAMKLRKVADGFTNDRCSEELAARERQRKANTETAIERERKRRESSVKLPDDIRETSANQHGKQVENLKIPNENSLGVQTSCTEIGTTRARLDTDTDIDNTPLPPKGGAPRRKRDPFTKAELAASDEALRLWNETAMRLGLQVCNAFSPQRRARMVRRLGDIGGLDNLKLALGAIERVPFLMGQVPPRDGEAPFRMSIDHLMQTDGKLGDVLAKLIDRAGDVSDLKGPNGKRWGWWRGHEDNIRKMPIEYWRKLDAECKPNGTWPWWAMGPPPGHPDCLMPPEIVAERGYVEIYKGKISHA